MQGGDAVPVEDGCPVGTRGVCVGLGDAAVRVARAAWLRLVEPPSPAAVELIGALGPVVALEAVLAGEAPPAVLAATRARTVGRSAVEIRELAERDLAVAADRGGWLVYPEHPEWPAAAMAGFALAQRRGTIGAAEPIGLYVRGRLPAGLPSDAVTIVGSRASSGYGNRVAGELAGGLVRAGVTVVSGGAFGIDTAAHRSALLSHGSSLAVLACGIDRAYPSANAVLIGRIAETGAVVSEYPPGATPQKHRFLVRNRLLAALSSVTVVVEAGRRSGSLSTAAAAGHLGRVVMAVPGPVTSAMSVGCHLLLRDRFALLAGGVDDVLAAARPLGDVVPGGRPPRRPTDGLDPVGLRVYDALPTRDASTVRELSVESGIDAAVVLETLPVLELAGLVERTGPLWRRISDVAG